MTIAALAATGRSSPDGLAYDVKSKVDELVAAVNATDVISSNVPVAAVADIKPTANTTAPTAHTASTAIAGTYADLAAARTSVNALRTDLETALGELDGVASTLRTEVEARLDAIETKVDLILARLRTAAILAE